MSTVNSITTGEQSVTATGAITGTLTTTSLAQTGFIHVRVAGLTAGQAIRVAVEDTNNATPFSDATTVAVFDIAQGVAPDDNEYSIAMSSLPSIRWGATNTKLRLNATAITGSTTAKVFGWLSQ